MNMLLHGAGGAATIEQGDTLFSPAFLTGGRVRRFDYVIANPPFSSKNWGHDKLKAGGDPFGRIKHLPPKRHGEMAFVQHMVASLDDDGRMAVVLPNGALFRARNEQLVRRDLIEADIVEAVIQLPKDMFYGAGIPACYLIINKAKPARADGPGSVHRRLGVVRAQDTKNVMRDDDINRIVAAYRDDATRRVLGWVSLEEMRARRYNLTVRRYVRGIAKMMSRLSLAEAVAELRASREECRAADARIGRSACRAGRQ